MTNNNSDANNLVEPLNFAPVKQEKEQPVSKKIIETPSAPPQMIDEKNPQVENPAPEQANPVPVNITPVSAPEISTQAIPASIPAIPVITEVPALPDNNDISVSPVMTNSATTELEKKQAVSNQASEVLSAPRLVILPALQTDDEVDAALTQLRRENTTLTHLSPRWYKLNPAGEWSDQSGQGAKLLRLFARYTRLKLLPVVEVPSQTVVDAASLVAEASKRRQEGFVLLFGAMPDKAWIDTLQRGLTGSLLKVFIVTMDSSSGTGKMIGAGVEASGITGEQSDAVVPVVPWLGPDGIHKPINQLPLDKSVLLTM